jgi:hypothetical protein
VDFRVEKIITNQLLYQLSYISEGRHSSKNANPAQKIGL